MTTGAFDNIQAVVDRLGFERDVYCGDGLGNYGARTLFGDWDLLSTYDVVMVNCGLTVDFDSAEARVMVANLQRFVQQGGSLYVSDLAASLIKATWPTKLQFRSIDPPVPVGRRPDPCCNCVDCAPECGARPEAQRPGIPGRPDGGQCTGVSDADPRCVPQPSLGGMERAGHYRANVPSLALQRFLGRDTLDVQFEVDGWVAVAGMAPDVEVLVEANGQPLMVLFEDRTSGGRVAFTTFHNEAQVAADVEKILQALIFQL